MAIVLLHRLAALDTNTVSDALDLLGLAGVARDLCPLWNCPKIVGRATTVLLGPDTEAKPTVHLFSPVIDAITTSDRVLVISGGIEGICYWGDVSANAAVARGIRGTVVDGLSKDIQTSEAVGYPVYGRGVTKTNVRDRTARMHWGRPVKMAGVNVNPDDYVLADRRGTVFIPQASISEVLDLGERVARGQHGAIAAMSGDRFVPYGEQSGSLAVRRA